MAEIKQVIENLDSSGKITLSNILDKYTGEYITFKEIDYVPTIIDNIIFKHRNNKYFKRGYSGDINAEWFGVDPSLNNNSVQLQQAIDIIHSMGGGVLYISSGLFKVGTSIIIKSGVTIKGNGDTIISGASNNLNTIIKSPDIVEIDITLLSDFNNDTNEAQIAGVVSKGDFIRYKSTRRFTEPWDRGTEIRPQYIDGEILKVKELIGNTLTHETVPYLNFPLSTIDNVKAFTPNRKGAIYNITVEVPFPTPSETYAIVINGWDGFNIDNVETKNTSVAGVQINKSFNVTIGTIKTLGGSSDLGLNYGVSVNDGSKYTTIGTVVGTNHRHVVASGGTGYAVPMYANIENVIGITSLGHTADCHANSAFFTFKSVKGNNGISVSGIGHKVLNCESNEGSCPFAYEGGTNLYFGNINIDNVPTITSNRCIINSYFDNVKIGYKNLKNGGVTSFKFNSVNNTFNNLSIINKDYIDTADENINDATVTVNSLYGIITYDNWVINNFYVEGFPIGIFINGPNIKIGNLKTLNCGWTTSLNSTNRSCILMNYLCTQLLIEGGVLENTNSIIRKVNVPYIRANPGQPCSGVTIKNLKAIGSLLPIGAIIPADFINTFLQNVRLGSGTNTVAATGKFIYNTIVADN